MATYCGNILSFAQGFVALLEIQNYSLSDFGKRP
jgi:hypothetical protein